MPKLKLSVKAVLLDMDGVITNTMPDHFSAWRKVFKDRGIIVTHLDIYKREGQPGIHSVKEISSEHKKSFKPGEARKILENKERIFKRIVKTRFIPGARHFIRMLHRRGFQLALVTGTSRHEAHRILPARYFKLFDAVVTGSDVRHGKPHPEPYLKALKKLGIKPREAIVIENAPFGIRSANRARIRCLALETSLPRKFLKESAAIFSSFRELQYKVKLNVFNHQNSYETGT